MPFTAHTSVLASDFSTLATTIDNVYGVGTGNTGYGQTAFTKPAFVASHAGDVSHNEWTTLFNMVSACASHQGTTNTASAFLTHTDITAANCSALSTTATLCSTNRQNIAGGESALTLNTFTNARATDWGTGGSASIACTFTVSWSDENHARYYFNAGGQIRIRLAHANVSSAQDIDWNNVLANKVGTVTVSAAATSNSGSFAGTATSKGYYQLTGTTQFLYNGSSIGGAPYGANSVTIQAQRTGFVGANGGNGSGIQFLVTLNDAFTNVYDLVHSGTAMATDIFYATNHVVVTPPTFALVSGF